MKKHFKPLALGMGFGLMLILLIAAAVPFAAFNANQFTSSTANNSVSIASGALTTNINLAGTVAGSPTLSGKWIWTNNTQVFKPLVQFVTNVPMTFTFRSVFVTAPSGTWDTLNPGDNINPSPGTNNDQYTFMGKLNATTGVIANVAQHTYTADTGVLIYPDSIYVTDINGNKNGLGIDPGGDLVISDASGSGNSPAAISIMSPALNIYDAGGIDLQSVNGYGTILTMGGLGGESFNSTRAWFVSTMAPQFSAGVFTNGMLAVQYGIEGYNGSSSYPVPFPAGASFPTIATNQPLLLQNMGGSNVLISTTGGSSGQVLTSTGSSTIPAWSNSASGGTGIATNGGTGIGNTLSNLIVVNMTNQGEFLLSQDSSFAGPGVFGSNGAAGFIDGTARNRLIVTNPATIFGTGPVGVSKIWNLGIPTIPFGIAYIQSNLMGNATVTNTLTVSNAAITVGTFGTTTFTNLPTFPNEGSNTFLAGPINGGASAAPTFRLLAMSDFKAALPATNMNALTNFDCLSAVTGFRATTNTAIAFQLTNEFDGPFTWEIDLFNTGATATPNVTVTASTGRNCRAANQTPGATVSYATPAANRVLRILITGMNGTNNVDFLDNY